MIQRNTQVTMAVNSDNDDVAELRVKFIPPPWQLQVQHLLHQAFGFVQTPPIPADLPNSKTHRYK